MPEVAGMDQGLGRHLVGCANNSISGDDCGVKG